MSLCHILLIMLGIVLGRFGGNMPSRQRNKTRYPGVYYVMGKSPSNGKPEKVYFIQYRKNGNLHEEKVGWQYVNNMSPAKASHIRAKKINSELPTNQEKREEKGSSKWTIEALWGEYRIAKSQLKRLKDQEYQFNKHIRNVFGTKEPQDITPKEVDSLKSNLFKTYTPQTVVHILNQIKRLVKFGVNRNLCKPLSFIIEMPKYDNHKTEDLSEEELRSLLSVLECYHDIQVKTLMLIALYTGMRKNEILRLRWDDIDFINGFIHIRDPKGVFNQHIPLNSEVSKLLQNLPKTPNSPYLFASPSGEVRNRNAFNRQMNEIKKEASLPKDFRPLHGLRHVYASILASSGQVDMYTLQKLLTHKSPQMTQRYAHLRDDALKKASNLAGKIIQNALGKSIKEPSDE